MKEQTKPGLTFDSTNTNPVPMMYYSRLEF